MKKTLALFMSVAIVMTILVSIYYGLTYQTLKQKHSQDVDAIDNFQINEK